MFQFRRKFSIRRNSTNRWKQAISGDKSNVIDKKPKQQLSVTIKATNMNIDEQKQAVDIANLALDTCGIENEIATKIKKEMDEVTGHVWHVIVGRNFGSHVSFEKYIHFTATKITILVFQCG
uniref:Dynein light chain n=2 Tax=Acrobeloides nanus TaxID=290746 RepID=A0A914DTI2_9BILA